MITIYEGAATDFGGLGLGTLAPSRCEVREEAGGLWEAELEQPITGDGRAALIANGRILRIPTPVRESPAALEAHAEETVEVTRQIWTVNTHAVHFRTGPGTGYRTLKYLGQGAEVMKTGESGSWTSCMLVDGGAAGWIHSQYLTLKGTATERIDGDEPGGVVETAQARGQLFRIYSVTPDGSRRTVTARAQHITYDLKGVIVNGDYKPEGAGAAEAVAAMLNMADHAHPFSVHCMAEGEISADYGGRNLMECLLDPEDGILAKTKGRLMRDNFDIYILKDEERTAGPALRRGKNLISDSMTTDAAAVVTRIKPVGRDKKGDPLYITSGDGFVESPRAGEYPIAYSKQVSYNVRVGSGDGEFATEALARAELERLAAADFSDNGADAPTVSLDVEYARLELTEQYRQWANEYALHLYDSVKIIDGVGGISTTARMSAYTWDALAGRYTETRLGDLTEARQTVYGYEIGGRLDGQKLVPGSVDGRQIAEGGLDYKNMSEDARERLMRLYGREIPANDDLNDYTEGGCYYAVLANVSGIGHAPSEKAFSLLVFRTDEKSEGWARTVQIAQELASPYDVYIRVNVNGWKDWRKIAETADIAPVVESYFPLSVANGGTGGTTPTEAREALNIGHAPAYEMQLSRTATGADNVMAITGSSNQNAHGFAVFVTRSDAANAVLLVDYWSANIGVIGELPTSIVLQKSANSDVLTMQNNSGAAVMVGTVNATIVRSTNTTALTENVTRVDYAKELADAAEAAAKSYADTRDAATLASAKGYTDTEAAKKINAYGTEITSGDLNDYKTSGHYFFTATTAANLSHCPTGVGGVLLVFRGDASTNTTSQRTVQVVYEVASPHKAYMRAHYNGSWRDWQTVVFSTDLASAISGMLTTSDVANNLTTTAAGKVLDARQGKALADEVTARAVTDKVRKTMRVGGRNLLIDTQEMNLTATDGTTWRTSNGTGEASRYAGTDGFYRIKLYSSGASADTSVSGYSPRLSLGADWTGKKLTFSMDVWANNWAQVDQGCKIYFMINSGDQSWTYYSNGRLICKTDSVAWGDDIVAEKTCHSQQWLRAATTIELTEANFPNGSHSGLTFADMTDVFVLVRLTRNGDVRFCRPKLEWGEIDTDWSPAPSDLEDHAEGYADGVGASTLQSVKDYLGKVPTNIYQLGSSSGSNTVTVTGSANENNNGFAVLVKRSYTSYALILVDLWTQNIGIIGKLPTSLKITKDSGNTRTIQLQNGTGAAVVCIGLNCTFEGDGTTTALTENVTRNNYEESLLEGIGNTTSENPSAVTVANETVTNLASVTLSAGTYILEGVASFGTNASGYRQLGFGNSATSANRDRFAITRVGACSGVATAIQVVTPVKLTSSTTLYLNGYQDSGGSLTVTGGIRYTKIR